MSWISSQIGESFNMLGNADNVHDELKSGAKLAKYV